MGQDEKIKELIFEIFNINPEDTQVSEIKINGNFVYGTHQICLISCSQYFHVNLTKIYKAGVKQRVLFYNQLNVSKV